MVEHAGQVVGALTVDRPAPLSLAEARLFDDLASQARLVLQHLTLAEVVSRAEAFEMTYNPNDCVELRWGAKAGSDEMSTCRAHAPAEQRAKMESSRAWFRDRKRPPR